ncbi:MAG TPA: hypothetical protein VJ385_01560 [Fibrobacteria bacterium]|nr:hypothetical protein [Fibrobacteria bacterium]
MDALFSPQNRRFQNRPGRRRGRWLKLLGFGTSNAGSITIPIISDTRIKGSFKGTLAPDKGKPSTVDMVVVGGEFDVGVK